MLKFTQEQINQLAVLESRRYVDRVQADIAQQSPELVTDDLKQRLYGAFDYAVARGIGEEREGAMTQFLYFEASFPGFYNNPGVNAWLTKPGASGDQRWADALAVLNNKMGIQPSNTQDLVEDM